LFSGFPANHSDASALKRPFEVQRAPVVQPFVAKSAGKVKKMDAETLGHAPLLLGGGRQTTDDAIDFAVGPSGIKEIGERVETKEPLAFSPCA
jgi:thymidine phosphorylase